MPRGGVREAGEGKKIGRPAKTNIPISADKGIASRVLASPVTKDAITGELIWPGEEARWLQLLNAKDERLRFDVQKYLTDRRDGRPAQGVFEGDTRETARELDFGDLPMPASPVSAKAGKPN